MKKGHIALGLNTHQRQRLANIADFIETVPQENFHMELYLNDNKDEYASIRNIELIDELLTHECDAVGCIVGLTVLHRREIGIKIATQSSTSDPKVREICWRGTRDMWSGHNAELSEYLFNVDWKYIDNDPKNAAKRIRYVLKNGLPDNWQEQMSGQDPLLYLEPDEGRG